MSITKISTSNLKGGKAKAISTPIEEDRAIDINFLVVAGGAGGYHSYGG